MQDFLKSSTAGFQSSLGEWTLGEVLCAPLFGDRILKGAMSPDRLKFEHNLSDSEIGNLYRILHVFSKGFQDLVQRATCRAQNQSELIKVVWVTYAQLWDAEAHVPFASCVASLFQERDAASGDVTAFQKKAMELGDLNAALQSRASDIVQGSLDRIAVEGQLAAENKSLQGEVATLVASNDMLGARASRLRKDKQALRLRVDSLESMLASADDRVRRAVTCCANLAMWPQLCTILSACASLQMKQHDTYIGQTQKILKERNMLLKAENEGKVKAQESLASASEKLAAVTTQASIIEAQLASSSAQLADMESAVADARRNFALLRSNFQGQTSEMHTAKKQAAAAAAKTLLLGQKLEVRPQCRSSHWLISTPPASAKPGSCLAGSRAEGAAGGCKVY